MSPQLEWRMWRQLRGAFGIKKFVFTPIVPEFYNVGIDQYATMEEALAHCSGELLFLEPHGEYKVSEIKSLADEEVTFVLGNTEFGNMKFAHLGKTVRINSKDTDLYGTNAAAIALAFWFGQ